MCTEEGPKWLRCPTEGYQTDSKFWYMVKEKASKKFGRPVFAGAANAKEMATNRFYRPRRNRWRGSGPPPRCAPHEDLQLAMDRFIPYWIARDLLVTMAKAQGLAMQLVGKSRFERVTGAPLGPNVDPLGVGFPEPLRKEVDRYIKVLMRPRRRGRNDAAYPGVDDSGDSEFEVEEDPSAIPSSIEHHDEEEEEDDDDDEERGQPHDVDI